MKKIFEALRKDHEVQRKLLNDLVKTTGDSETRKNTFEALKFELTEHAKFEERYFYKPLMESDMVQPKARHSIAEHKEIDDIVEDLDEMEFSSTGWLTRAKTLKDKVEHHLAEEEHEIFQLAGKEFSETEKVEIAKKHIKSMREERMERHHERYSA